MDSKLIVKWCALLPMLAIAACASQRPAPVVDRSGRSRRDSNRAHRQRPRFRARLRTASTLRSEAIRCRTLRWHSA